MLRLDLTGQVTVVLPEGPDVCFCSCSSLTLLDESQYILDAMLHRIYPGHTERLDVDRQGIKSRGPVSETLRSDLPEQ